MVIAFIDESGKLSNLPFLVTAILSYSYRTVLQANQSLRNIKLKFGMDPSYEIHASELFHPLERSPYAELDKRNKLNEFIEEVVNTISSLDISVTSVVIKNVSVRNVKVDVEEQLLRTSYEYLIERILLNTNKLNLNDEGIFLIHDLIDAKEEGKSSGRQSLLTKIIDKVLMDGYYVSKMRNRLNVVMPIVFANSSRYGLLQLADVTGFLVRRQFYRKSSAKFDFEKLYNVLLTKFDTKKGKVYGAGLKVVEVLEI